MDGGMPQQMAGPMPPMPVPQQGLPPELMQVLQVLPPEIQQQVQSMPPDQQVAFLSQPPEQIAQQIKQLQELQQPNGSGMEGGQNIGQIQQLIAQLPPELQAQLIQMLQTDPEQAMAMLQQILGQQAGSF